MNAFRFIFVISLLFLFSGLAPAQSKRDEGIDLYRAGEFEKAVTALGEATKEDKKDSIAWVYLGASQLKQGNAKDALKAFRKGKIRKKDDLAGGEMKAEILDRPRPRFTDMARENNTSGIVRLAVELRSDGKIGWVYVVQGLPYGLTEQSIAAARSIKFRPPEKNGKPVTTVELIENTFEVR